jgi:hypothetical protein
VNPGLWERQYRRYLGLLEFKERKDPNEKRKK